MTVHVLVRGERNADTDARCPVPVKELLPVERRLMSLYANTDI